MPSRTYSRSPPRQDRLYTFSSWDVKFIALSLIGIGIVVGTITLTAMREIDMSIEESHRQEQTIPQEEFGAHMIFAAGQFISIMDSSITEEEKIIELEILAETIKRTIGRVSR